MICISNTKQGAKRLCFVSSPRRRGSNMFTPCNSQKLCYNYRIMLTKRQKTNTIKDVQMHATDTGSPEAQVALLSKKIDELAKHLKKNHKDNHSRKGLLGMVADRQSHLRYLAKKSVKRYQALIKKVGLKK